MTCHDVITFDIRLTILSKVELCTIDKYSRGVVKKQKKPNYTILFANTKSMKVIL